jgi:hypothetical protein
MEGKKKPNTAVNRTGSGPMKDKRTKRDRSRGDNKRNSINESAGESRKARDAQTRAIKPDTETPYLGRKTSATQWNRWTP